jgi:hypothetical protein
MARIYFLPVIILGILFVATSPAFAQVKVYKYTYNDSGNRTKRERDVIQLKSNVISDVSEYNLEQEILEEKFNGFDIKIFPNPTKGNITVSINELEDKAARIMVFNSLGRLITDIEFTSLKTTFSLYDQPSGIYILKIWIDDFTTEWKIIKE